MNFLIMLAFSDLFAQEPSKSENPGPCLNVQRIWVENTSKVLSVLSNK
jgi:hypothetical protein